MPLSAHQQVRAFYDDTAEHYNQIMDEEISLPLYDEVLSNLAVQTAALQGPLLDTSCGSGHMLAKLANQHAPGRALVGVDLSPNMVAIASARLGTAARIYEGDMAHLPAQIGAGECAAVISFFALHHIAPGALAQCLAEWRRVLAPGGKLLLATWEGEGSIDYGGHADIVTQRYREAELVAAAQSAGFEVNQSSARSVEGMEMDAVFLSATNQG